MTTRFSAADYQKRSGGGIKGFSPEFIEALTEYPWPGNVRELLTALETAIDKSRDDPVLYHSHLPSNIRVHTAQAALAKRRVLKDVPEPGPVGPGKPCRPSRNSVRRGWPLWKRTI
jgi:transcriptional regulator with PAS, ATPase and Fis domain